MASTVLIERVYNTGQSVKAIARIRHGTLKKEMHASVNGKRVIVRSIIRDYKRIEEAGPGSSVGIELKGSSDAMDSASEKTLIFSSFWLKDIFSPVVDKIKKMFRRP